jgi:sarcosine oxidase delta subunit
MIKYKCPYCEKEVTAKEVWKHMETCPKMIKVVDECVDKLEIDLDDEDRGKIV